MHALLFGTLEYIQQVKQSTNSLVSDTSGSEKKKVLNNWVVFESQKNWCFYAFKTWYISLWKHQIMWLCQNWHFYSVKGCYSFTAMELDLAWRPSIFYLICVKNLAYYCPLCLRRVKSGKCLELRKCEWTPDAARSLPVVPNSNHNGDLSLLGVSSEFEIHGFSLSAAFKWLWSEC